MMLDSKPVLIDFSQAVHIDHPSAKEFLVRDLENINRYFIGQGIKVKPLEQTLEGISR
jgi:RIO kinase 1